MKIKVDQVLKREAAKKLEIKPLPKVKLSNVPETKPPRSEVANGNWERKITQSLHDVDKARLGWKYADDPTPSPIDHQKEDLLKELWASITAIKKDRAKLSTRTWFLVQELHDRLKKEGEAIAQAFMAGDLKMPELAEHYAKIQAFTDQAIIVWDKIKYVEKWGKLPDPPAAELPEELPDDAAKIKYELLRLKDLIYKAKTRMKNNPNAKPSKVAEWKEKIALAEAQREQKRQDLKRMQYDAGE
jgi:hypothetical protein